ncbi:hypothetical protein ID866_3364 [Astraeus odoratus]|nr:hypothetical protein ID866_3364 [Astraeus odoratus]
METAPNVPYQAYRSKRHSRTVSSGPLVSNAAPPPISRPSSIISNGPVAITPAAVPPQPEVFETEKVPADYPSVVSVITDKTALIHVVPSTRESPSPPSPNGSATSMEPPQDTSPSSVSSSTVESPPPDQQPRINGAIKETAMAASASSPTPSPPVPPAALPSVATPKKTSTFRRVTPRSAATRSSLPSSPLRRPVQLGVSPSQSSSFKLDQSNVPGSPVIHSRVTSIGSVISDERPSTANRNFNTAASSHRHMEIPPPMIPAAQRLVQPPLRSSSQPPARIASPASASLSTTPAAMSPQASSSSSQKPTTNRSPAPYRPGFQPKGVYRPRTDEFSLARKVKSDAGRIERTKLERRLEKLINLHFPVEGAEPVVPKRGADQRRSSSFFDVDISNFKNMDAADIWKGVLKSQAFQGAKADIRGIPEALPRLPLFLHRFTAAEQRITPWQEDSAVSKCPFCTSSFHPLTNRKHHCRLCGQIICSLPIKAPQRPEPCSILFIVDSKTRQIEEVGEGVDYGVRKRRSVDPKRKGKHKEDPLPDDEKFLKGVRICRGCKPILAREQYRQDVVRIPVFVRLYEAFVGLEKEIEEWLPQFQELLSTLSSDTHPTKEASTARKRLLEAFAEYDALSKRIRNLPCLPGSPQDRVQLAVVTRANLFLQKNMFPLQFLPKTKKSGPSDSLPTPEGPSVVDPDSELAYTLQPLLEQEALLESFVGEAMAHRKFEDAKALKANLAEIRAEIDRMLAGMK